MFSWRNGKSSKFTIVKISKKKKKWHEEICLQIIWHCNNNQVLEKSDTFIMNTDTLWHTHGYIATQSSSWSQQKYNLYHFNTSTKDILRVADTSNNLPHQSCRMKMLTLSEHTKIPPLLQFNIIKQATAYSKHLVWVEKSFQELSNLPV